MRGPSKKLRISERRHHLLVRLMSMTQDQINADLFDEVKRLRKRVLELESGVEDNAAVCPHCGAVPDTHRKMQVRHLHVKSQQLVKFIEDLQKLLGLVGGPQTLLVAVQNLQANA